MEVKKSIIYWIGSLLLLFIILIVSRFIYNRYYSPVTTVNINSQVKDIKIESTDKKALEKYLIALNLIKNPIYVPGINNIKIIKSFNFIVTNVPQSYDQAFWPDQKEPIGALGYATKNTDSLNIYIYLHPLVLTRLKQSDIEKIIDTEIKRSIFLLSLEFKGAYSANKSTDKTYRQLRDKYSKLIPNTGFVHIKINEK